MNSCQQYHQFLNQFKPFAPKPDTNIAYQIKQGDVVDYIDNNVAELITPAGRIEFTHEQQVSLGDFIVTKTLSDAYHVSQTLFKKLHFMAGEAAALPGQPVIEEFYPGHEHVVGKVLKIADRYFIEIKNGKVRTTPYLKGARIFKRHNEKDQAALLKLITELEQRKKKPTAFEVGFWSRDAAASEGGAA